LSNNSIFSSDHEFSPDRESVREMRFPPRRYRTNSFAELAN
jgi:hypothetical protein